MVFARFLDTAHGSAFEVETQLLIAKNFGYMADELYVELQNMNVDIQKQLSGLLASIRKA